MGKARCIKNMNKFQLLTLFKQLISELVVYDILCQNPIIDKSFIFLHLLHFKNS